MPLRPSAPVGDTIRELVHHGSRPRPMNQIIAIAEANHRRRAFGGGLGGDYRTMMGAPQAPQASQAPAMPGRFMPRSAAPAMPMAAQRAFRSGGGIAHSTYLGGDTLGRADHVMSSVAPGAYVIPADVIAGLGDGNSEAGARVWDDVLQSMLAHSPRLHLAHGGRGKGIAAPEPVALSHGEAVVGPDDVRRIGGGSYKSGWAILDHFVKKARAHHIAELKKLAPPVGSKA